MSGDSGMISSIRMIDLREKRTITVIEMDVDW